MTSIAARTGTGLVIHIEPHSHSASASCSKHITVTVASYHFVAVKKAEQAFAVTADITHHHLDTYLESCEGRLPSLSYFVKFQS